MIKDLLDLFKALASERSKQRSKLIKVLEQVSTELSALSSSWSKIATMADADEISDTAIREALRDQRSHYEGLLLFRSELFHGDRKQSPSSERFVRILDSAVGEKSVLYRLVRELLGDRSDLGEAKDFVPAGPPNIINKIAFIKKQREAAGLTERVVRERKTVAREILERAEELSGLSGQFGAAVALFKAETPFI
jgi:CHAD domain-containing protein